MESLIEGMLIMVAAGEDDIRNNCDAAIMDIEAKFSRTDEVALQVFICELYF